MASESGGGEHESAVRKLGLPVVVSAAAGAAGVLWSNRQRVRDALPKVGEKVRDAVPNMPDASDLPIPGIGERGVGDLTQDLRGKLDDVLGKESQGDEGAASSSGSFDSAEFQERRKAREQRRNQRRRGSRS